MHVATFYICSKFQHNNMFLKRQEMYMGKISTYSTDKKYNGQNLYYYSKEYNIMGKFQYIFITQKYIYV